MLSCVWTGPHSESDPRSQSSHFHSSDEVDDCQLSETDSRVELPSLDPLAL